MQSEQAALSSGRDTHCRHALSSFCSSAARAGLACQQPCVGEEGLVKRGPSHRTGRYGFWKGTVIDLSCVSMGEPTKLQ